MLEALGYIVQRLKRVEYARIGLDGLKPGEWRYLTEEEFIEAKKLATPKPPVFRKPEPEEKPEGEPVKKEKKGKKGGKKKKKQKDKLKKAASVQQPSSGSDVLESISKELENISEQISDNKED